MWNKNLIEFLKELSLQYPDVLFVLEDVGTDSMPVAIYAGTDNTSISDTLRNAYKKFLKENFNEALNIPEECATFATFLQVVREPFPVELNATFIRGGVICE